MARCGPAAPAVVVEEEVGLWKDLVSIEEAIYSYKSWGVIIEPYLLGALLVVEFAFTFKCDTFTLIPMFRF